MYPVSLPVLLLQEPLCCNLNIYERLVTLSLNQTKWFAYVKYFTHGLKHNIIPLYLNTDHHRQHCNRQPSFDLFNLFILEDKNVIGQSWKTSWQHFKFRLSKCLSAIRPCVCSTVVESDSTSIVARSANVSQLLDFTADISSLLDESWKWRKEHFNKIINILKCWFSETFIAWC